MQDAGRFRPLAAAALAALTAAVIVYGSLYPFRFRGPADWPAAAATLLASWPVLTSRADLISNLLLYAPLGFFGVRALPRLRGPIAVGLLTLLAALLSSGVEMLQFRMTGRITSMSDVYMNVGGAFAGALAGRLAPLALSTAGLGREPARGFAWLTLAAWFGWRLFPYVPTLDWKKIKSALKPLLLSPEPPPLDFFRHFAGWLAVAVLLEAAVGPERRRAAFTALVFAVLGLRCLLVGVVLTPAEVAGAAAALFAWHVWLAGAPARPRLVLLLLAGAIALQSLEPYTFMAEPKPFGWVPFRSLIVGSMETNVRSFLEKSFLYGALLWLLARSGFRFFPAAAMAIGFVAALKWGQTWLPRRSAEITDVLLVAILALVLRLASGRRGGAT